MADRIDVDKPLWDQSTFYGRFRHFAWLTNPLNGIYSTSELHESKKLLECYRISQESSGTRPEQVVHAMKLYHSSFHPDSHELQNLFGRMSFQVPGGMLITGAMLQFYKTVPQIMFWQWCNQSFNALVNYTNRNANSPLTTTQLTIAYISATFSALGSALGLKKILQTRASPMFQRFVPFMAVASANCVNIPLMRQAELKNGVDLYDKTGTSVGKSRFAAALGISQVTLSRILMMTPGMLCLPFIMKKLESNNWFARRTVLHAPFQVLGVGTFLILMVPVACAIFPQTAVISSNSLKRFDPEVYAQLKQKNSSQSAFYFNKGL